MAETERTVNLQAYDALNYVEWAGPTMQYKISDSQHGLLSFVSAENYTCSTIAWLKITTIRPSGAALDLTLFTKVVASVKVFGTQGRPQMVGTLRCH